ncbi:MAG: hypothetical protein ACERKV_08195 [Clostridiaceae bacterium]
MDIFSVLALAFIGEATWETLKMVWQNGKLNLDRIGALVVGIVLALASGFDLMEIIGFPFAIPFVGSLLTGILISRGANFVHDLLASVNNLQEKTKLISK